MVRVIGLENSLRVQTGANTRKYMQVNANKSDPYLHLFAWLCIYFAVVLRYIKIIHVFMQRVGTYLI